MRIVSAIVDRLLPYASDDAAIARYEADKAVRLSQNGGTGWGFFGNSRSAAGKSVTINSAMQLSSVWACVRQTSLVVSSLPIGMYEKRPDGSRETITDRVAEVLTVSPNSDQTGIEFWEGMVAWLMTNGNCYAEKQIGRAGLSGLHPLSALQVMPFRNSDGDLMYRFSDRGKYEVLPQDKMFHVRGFGFGGDMGLSAIQFGVQTMGTAIAADESAGKVFSNGMQISGFLKSSQVLKPQQRQQLREMLNSYRGSDAAWKVAILEAGLDFQTVTMNPEDAQLLETRRFSIEDICRWFGVPPIIIGHSAQGQTMWGSGVEQILLAWMNTGLNPILRRIEARIRKDLVPAGSRVQRYAEFNREGILQMDSKAKAEFLTKLVSNGIMSRNEAREKLNLARRDGADDLTAQTAMAPVQDLGDKESQT